MQSPRESLLCQYRYDPLDRLIANALSNKPEHQRFYCQSRLTTEIQGAMRFFILQHDGRLLAQQQDDANTRDTTLLASDQQRSILQALKASHPLQPIAYSPYGHRTTVNGLLSLLGFNGERPDPVTGCYLLGNGYRAFNPVLMRFISPDNLSPFGKGGVNSYAYCLGNPVNSSDPSGQIPLFKKILNSLFEPTDPNSKSWIPRFGHRPHSVSQRRLSDPGPAIPSLTDPDFMGYHGTSRDSANKLLKEGVQPQRSETRPGFFLSPDKELAVDYANRQQYRSTKEDLWKFGKENIVEVHIQNLAGKTPGKDYEFNPYGFNRHLDHMLMEFMPMPHISRAITIRQLGSTPATQKVRPRAFEAPF